MLWIRIQICTDGGLQGGRINNGSNKRKQLEELIDGDHVAIDVEVLLMIAFVVWWTRLQVQEEEDHDGFHKEPPVFLFTSELGAHVFIIISELGLLKVEEQEHHVGSPIETRLD